MHSQQRTDTPKTAHDLRLKDAMQSYSRLSRTKRVLLSAGMLLHARIRTLLAWLIA